MSFEFRALSQPFPRWFGPYSAGHGRTSGFRIRGGLLRTIVRTPTGEQTWFAHQNDGVRRLQSLVVSRWGGGRVLLLPNGWVIKPDQAGNGIRWAIGRFSGPLILQRPDGTWFNMAAPGALQPGMRWPGPDTTGLKCVLDITGTLRTKVTRPTTYCEEIVEITLVAGDAALARGLRAARPGDWSASVRVTENGHVITKRQDAGEWTSVYVGFVDPARWPHDEAWVEGAVSHAPAPQTTDRADQADVEAAVSHAPAPQITDRADQADDENAAEALEELRRRMDEVLNNFTDSNDSRPRSAPEALEDEIDEEIENDFDEYGIESEPLAVDDVAVAGCPVPAGLPAPTSPQAQAENAAPSRWSQLKSFLSRLLGGT